jgi:hypothetical protein
MPVGATIHMMFCRWGSYLTPTDCANIRFDIFYKHNAMIDTVLKIFKLAGVGLTAGLFSSVLANRDHRQRKWWELRVSAYQNAIEALSDLVYIYDCQIEATMANRDIPEKLDKELDAYWEQSYPKIRKFADSGALLFSDEANNALRELIRDDYNNDFNFEYLEHKQHVTEKCLNSLVECSKVDLKLKPILIERVLRI